MKPTGNLVVMGAFPGAGKTTTARLLEKRLRAAGRPAVVIDYTAVRLQYVGLRPGEDASVADTHAYKQTVYKAMFDRTARELAEGKTVILCASFRKPIYRRWLEDFARRQRIRSTRRFWLDASADTRRFRIAERIRRRYHASRITPASVDVHEREGMGRLPFPWRRIGVDHLTPEQVARKIFFALNTA